MSMKKCKISLEGSNNNKNNIHILNRSKYYKGSMIYTYTNNSNNKKNINSQRNQKNIQFNNTNKYHKYIYQKSFTKEHSNLIDNLKKLNYYKINISKNNSKSKKSSLNTRPKSNKEKNSSKNKDIFPEKLMKPDL